MRPNQTAPRGGEQRIEVLSCKNPEIPGPWVFLKVAPDTRPRGSLPGAGNAAVSQKCPMQVLTEAAAVGVP